MMAFRFPLVLLAALVGSAPVHAYDTEYRLSGRFLVETTHVQTGQKALELWQVRFLRGTVPQKPPITDLEVLRVSLLGSDQSGYAIKDISSEEFHPHTGHVLHTGSEFVFSIGIASKFNLKLLFFPSGDLSDLSGSITSEIDPTNVTMFKLVRDSKDIRIVESYRFVDSYQFHRRAK